MDKETMISEGKFHSCIIRATLPTRQTFFDDIRALMRYHCFPSWAAMMDFMMRGLEIGHYANEKA